MNLQDWLIEILDNGELAITGNVYGKPDIAEGALFTIYPINNIVNAYNPETTVVSGDNEYLLGTPSELFTNWLASENYTMEQFLEEVLICVRFVEMTSRFLNVYMAN